MDVCKEHRLKHQIICKDLKANYESIQAELNEVIDELDRDYAGKKKGIFISNDTHANIFLNLLFRKHGGLPADYLIVGFDNSPISREAVIPISTVGQQIDKIAYEAVNLLVEQMNERKKRRPVPLDAPIHKIIPPVLIRRETTEG